MSKQTEEQTPVENDSTVAVEIESGHKVISTLTGDNLGKAFTQALLAKAQKNENINSFVDEVNEARKTIGTILAAALIPVINCAELDSRVATQQALIESAAEDKKVQREALKVQIATLDAEISKAEIGPRAGMVKLSLEREALFVPRIQAIEALNAQVQTVPNFQYAIKELASTVIGAAQVIHASGTGTGGGRSNGAVTLSKNGVTTHFASLNAARRAVYAEIKGDVPQYQANAAACERYLTSKGYAVTVG